MASEFSLDELQLRDEIATLHYRAEMTSTSDVCRELFPHVSKFPLLVLTDRQTAGRGQQDRSWWSATGALTFTWSRNSIPQPESTDGLMSLAVALAVADAIDSLAGCKVSKIKWPNDVFVGGKKVAGILIESIWSDGVRYELIGVGVNVNNTMSDAPTEIVSSATSLSEHFEKRFGVQELLMQILEGIPKTHSIICPQLTKRCLKKSIFAPGEPIKLNTTKQVFDCQFHGFGTAGELLVYHDGQIKAFVSGRIV